MDVLKWVFGLSIDDELCWAIAPVNPDLSVDWDDAYPLRSFPHGKIADLPNRRTKQDPLVSLKEVIIDALDYLSRHPDTSKLLKEVVAVGVSSIGLVNRLTGRLVDVRRKPWKPEYKDTMLNLPALFARAIPQVLEGQHGVVSIAVQNDATAKCIAHRVREQFNRQDDVLCAVMINDGVNIGVANGIGPVSSSDLHPELGHGYPQLSKLDEAIRDRPRYLRRISGCPIHLTCYEGIASGARMKAEWHGSKIELIPNKQHRDHAVTIISDYLAQLCWTATLAIAPTRILVCGTSVSEGLVDSARKRFWELNSGGAEPYLSARAYEVLSNDKAFISLAKPFDVHLSDEISNVESIMASIELARRAASRRRRDEMVYAEYAIRRTGR